MPDDPRFDEPLPLNYRDWTPVWGLWASKHLAHAQRCDHQWPPPSIMADAVLGRWHIDARCVELSDVTMPPPAPSRHVGVWYLTADGDTEPGPVVDTLTELEAELWSP